MIAVLYLVGLALMAAEAFVPGLVLGLVGVVLVATSVVFGFRTHWAVGTVQIGLVLVVGPAAALAGMRRLRLEATLGGSPFAGDYASLAGRSGTAATDLRPAGTVLIDGRRVDVVTAGEQVPQGTPVRIVRVEGNRIVVQAL